MESSDLSFASVFPTFGVVKRFPTLATLFALGRAPLDAFVARNASRDFATARLGPNTSRAARDVRAEREDQ
jgi:hypothetical protein